MEILKTARSPLIGGNISQETSAFEVKFGDGYSQRAYSGINAKVQVLELTWTWYHAEMLSLYKWLKEREKVIPFLYTYTNDKQRAYICQTVRFIDNAPYHGTVTATFKEVFDIRYQGD